MPFRFSLEAVLRWRENLEQTEYIALEKIQQQITQAQARLREAEDLIREAQRATNSNLSQGIPSAHLQSYREQERAFEKRRDDVRHILEELAAQRSIRLTSYQNARQKREILERLRTQQRFAYEHALQKREQAMLDEIFLARRKRNE